MSRVRRIKNKAYYNSTSPFAGNNSTFRTAQNIKDTARRLKAAARGNSQRQRRIDNIEYNYLRAVGAEPLFSGYAVTNEAGAVLTKVRGGVTNYTITSRNSLTYQAAKGNSKG